MYYSYPSKYPNDDPIDVDDSQVDVLLRSPDYDPTVNSQADSPPVNGILNYTPEYVQ